jgi:archaetidylinositol phosphate synthase
VVLDRFRPAADRLLVPLARHLGGVNPNLISWAGLLAAGIAGVAFYVGGLGFLILALFLILVSAYLDALDGKVAKLFGKASARGDFVDHVFDRYADVFLLGGVAFNAAYAHLWVGALAIIGVLLTSYMGTQAQAVGQGRHYGGILGRADRLVLLFLGGLLQLVVAPSGGVLWGVGVVSFGPLEWILVIFAVLANATAVQRAIGIWRGFDAGAKGP